MLAPAVSILKSFAFCVCALVRADSYSKLEPPFFGSALHSRTYDVIFSNVSCWDTRTRLCLLCRRNFLTVQTSSGVPAANGGSNLEYESSLRLNHFFLAIIQERCSVEECSSKACWHFKFISFL